MTAPSRAKSVNSERAVLVGVLPTAPGDDADPLGEIRGLAESAGALVAAEITQQIGRAHV